MKEKELVEKSLKGDKEAFGILVMQFQRKVFNLIYSLTRNKETADDLCQDVFIKAYCALKSFRFNSKFGTWLYRIAVNHTKDYLKKEGRAKLVSFSDQLKDGDSANDGSSNRKKTPETNHQISIVREGIRMLPRNFQIILSLRDIQGFSYQEISEILQLSQGTVDSRLFRARKMLKKIITPYIFGSEE